MKMLGTKFIDGATPSSLTRADPNGPITVTYKVGDTEISEEYQTVFFAIGRYALTAALNLDKAGVTCEKNGKIRCANEQTNVPNIFAIGDVLQDRLELTPVAIKAGALLSKRLFGNGTEQMDYELVPTCVFTPIEYGACGLSEEDAQKKFGKENLSNFHIKFKPLEWQTNKMFAGG